MCGRYYIAEEDMEEKLREVIEIINRRSTAACLKTHGEIFPTDTVPVIANDRSLHRSAFAMRWGYALEKGLLINARSETAAQRPLFRDGMAQRRCLVPASHYFEWERKGRERVKYAIRPEDGSPLYMAGIYRLEKGIAEFAILTRAPAENIAFIHDRMPVILPEALIAEWLDPSNRAEELLREAVMGVRYSAET